MDIQLKELIEKIKNDGVKSAEEKAAQIILDAENKASAIVNQAQNEARQIRETAKADADKTTRSGNEALRQSGRDLILMVKEKIQDIFKKILKNQIADTLCNKRLAESIERVLEQMPDASSGEMEIHLSEKDLAAMESALLAKLAMELKEGVLIKPFKELDGGFRISVKDGTAFYDFSDDEIARMLLQYLNPHLSQLLVE